MYVVNDQLDGSITIYQDILMNLAITIFDIAMMTLVSWVFLKKPLEEKDIEGGQSLLVRIVIGIVAGVVVSFMMSL